MLTDVDSTRLEEAMPAEDDSARPRSIGVTRRSSSEFRSDSEVSEQPRQTNHHERTRNESELIGRRTTRQERTDGEVDRSLEFISRRIGRRAAQELRRNHNRGVRFAGSNAGREHDRD